MAISPTSPVTGSAQTGLTSPTFTLTADTPPAANAKQWAITALGGTQTGVEAHSVAAPFTITFKRPAAFKTLPGLDSNGLLRNVPRNNYELLTRKGVIPLAGQAYQTGIIRTIIEVPAGADAADPESIRAALSAHIGALTQLSAGIGDTCVNGVV